MCSNSDMRQLILSSQGSSSTSKLPGKPIKPGATEHNRRFLASLDVAKVSVPYACLMLTILTHFALQVLALLDTMQLREYKGKFNTEVVSGAILVDIDDTILKDELGISSRLHRLRLLKVISGEHSAECILRGENPRV